MVRASRKNTTPTEAPAEGMKRREVAAMIGIGLRSLDQLVTADESFPRPVRIGPLRSIRFVRTEVLEWLRERAPRTAVPGERRNAS